MANRLMLPAQILTYGYDVLKDRLRPKTLEAPEANPFALYDTQTYPAAGVARLNFFTAVNSDPTLSNMELSGQLAGDNYFDIHRIFVRPLRELVANAAIAGPVNTVQKLLNTARGTVTITTNSKPLGPIPLWMFGDGGQASGFIQGAPAAAGTQQVGGFPDNGGFPVNGAIKLGPGSKFGVSIDFVAGVAVDADTALQVCLFGVAYRKIG